MKKKQLKDLRQRKEILHLKTQEIRQRFILLKRKNRKVVRNFRRIFNI